MYASDLLMVLTQVPLNVSIRSMDEQQERQPISHTRHGLRAHEWTQQMHQEETSNRQNRWPLVLLLLGALVLYAITLDNGLQPEELVGGDLITHQYAQVQARPSNAPGYPLYTMGGWLWFHGAQALLPWLGVALPNPLLILSSYSTLWALLALWLLYRILCTVTVTEHYPTGLWPLALLLSAFYGVTYFFWYYATTTEQYSSAIAQTLAIVYFYLRWQRRFVAQIPSPDGSAPLAPLVSGSPSPRNADRLLLLLALLCGVALAHMLTVAFIVPPLVAVILWQAPVLLRRGRLILGTVIAAFLPLTSYFYIYWRGVAHPEWWGNGEWTSGQAWFWSFLSTAQGREELGWGFEPWCTPFANGFPALMGAELSWPIIGLGLVGIAFLRHKLAPLLYATLAIYLLFGWLYRCGNWFQVVLPAYPLLLVGVAALLTRMVSSEQTEERRTLRWRQRLLYGLLVLAVLLRGAASWPRADSFNRVGDSALERAALQLTAQLPSNSALFAAVDDALALQYLTQVWRIRPDLTVVSSAEAAAQLVAGRPLYSTWEAAATLETELGEYLPGDFAFQRFARDAQWVRFQSATTASPPFTVDQQVQLQMTPDIMLQGYQLQTGLEQVPNVGAWPLTAPEGVMQVLLLWRVANVEWPEGLSISLRLTQDGVPVPGFQQDRALPALGLAGLVDGQILDPYLFHVTQTSMSANEINSVAHRANGVMVILYRQTATGFENVAVVQLP